MEFASCAALGVSDAPVRQLQGVPCSKDRLKSKEFCDLLGRLCNGEPTQRDAEIISNLHIGLYESDIALWTT